MNNNKIFLVAAAASHPELQQVHQHPAMREGKANYPLSHKLR